MATMLAAEPKFSKVFQELILAGRISPVRWGGIHMSVRVYVAAGGPFRAVARRAKRGGL